MRFWKIMMMCLCVIIIGCQLLDSEETNSDADQCDCCFPTPGINLSEEKIEQIIVGKWEWQCSRIMQRNIQSPNNLITPDSLGYTLQYEFLPTEVLRIYQNNELVEQHLYEVRKFKILPSDENEVTYLYIDDGGSMVYHISSDTLFFGTGSLDGIDNLYIRVR